MSVGLVSDDVAEDYKNSLEDLVINSKYEISNLTVIAKENTEHAMAISRVLQNHIRTTPPARKLPAMYVLDSVIKNVGTPYTLYLGSDIYNTFMHAYTVVDTNTRKKLDEMLRTWKEPVPGSLDTRPVFPPERTRPIENALIKARTAAHVSQQQQQFRAQQESFLRGRQVQTPTNGWSTISTPPQANGPFRPPPSQALPPQGFAQQQFPQHTYPGGQIQNPAPYPQFSQQPPPQTTPASYQSSPFQQHQQFQPPPPQQQPPFQHYLPPQENLESLHRNIATLIRNAQDEFAANVHDLSVQTRLKALIDLQTILNSQQLPPDQIQLVRNQVNALSATSRPPPPPQQMQYPPISTPLPYQPPSMPPQQQPFHTPQMQYTAPAQHPGPQQQRPQQPTDLNALLSSNNLADIIARAQRASVTPPMAPAALAQPSTNGAPAMNLIPPPASGGSDLMASLRAAGLVAPDAPTPVNGARPMDLPLIPTQSNPINDVRLTSASLKIPRPQLISILYEARPNQCTTCARRFLATEEGRAKKAAHLDWHFRTNQRLADASKRGSSRSWYVDELEWIKSRDNPETLALSSASGPEQKSTAGNVQGDVNPKISYIPVPSDQILANLPCPICQEKFDTVWNDEAQDFVWMDAIKIGAKVYHASCHREVRKEEDGRTPVGAGTGGRGTPDSILGKRKKGDE